VLEKNKDLLAADAWLFCDGPVHQSRRPVVFFGARGVTGLELTLYGPGRSLHSGHYGNWAPNPGAELASLVAGLHDREGRIAIDGFYEGIRPTTAEERDALRAVPAVESDLRRELQLAEGATPAVPLAEGTLAPALNVRGLESGRVGAAAANAIPTEARASLDFRLVPGQTPARVRELFEAHLRKQGYVIVADEPSPEVRRASARLVRLEWDAGYPASRVPMSSPFASAVVAAVGAATGQPVVRLPTLGGSIPMFLFDDVLGVQALGLPIANHDNNQHAANENLRMQNLRDGIAIFATVLAEAGKAWP
jgi:acetylornithine deacetylase/succinyl-diaminopimelate desuccinylase-like protein